ncbi:MAG: ATP synthase F1 subunit gamma [Deltaproteobacteria bacterium]|nr:ATP synthase F1 subunit gamma [Deltaproteobacteria bacterium]
MSTLRAIKRRIKSVKNTRQITKAMKMVSAAKLRRAQEEIVAARPFADRMEAMIQNLSSRVRPESHRLFSHEKTGKRELILILSDRGLCGSFNNALLRSADRFIRGNEGPMSLNLIGRRAFDHYKRRDITISNSKPLGTKRLAYGLAVQIAKPIIESYLKDDGADEVYMVFSRFSSPLIQIPVVQRILPMIPPSAENNQREILFEPSPEGVLDELLPKYVEVQVFRALLESQASEHGARMTAMDSATKNASSMIDALTLQYNRARQTSITKELMEIIGGAEALKA